MSNFITQSVQLTCQIRSVALFLVSLTLLPVGSACLAQTTSSVVLIYSKLKSRSSSQGTGFILGDQGLIVTAYHVVQDSTELTVKDSHNRDLEDITIEHIDPDHDLAVLHTSTSDLDGLRPAAHPPAAQANVGVAGNPRGLQNQLLFGRLTTQGTISSIKISAEDGTEVFAHDIDIYPVDVTIYGGMSGAPVLLSDNSVIGVFSGSYAEGRGLGWAIPYKYVQDLLSGPKLARTVSAMGAWPALTLMGPAWISLKRSYEQPFDADHIAELQVIGQAFQILRGTWTARNTSREKPSISGYGMGKCEKQVVETMHLTFNTVDENGPALLGHMAQSATVKAVLIPEDYGNFPVDMQFQTCNMFALNDEAVSESTMNIEGSGHFRVDDIDEYAQKPSLTTMLNISDCTGSGCSAALYGPHTSDVIEILSDHQLRFGNFILTRAGSE